MIKHMVMWRINETLDKPASAQRAKELLEGMAGKIPGLQHIEVGINFANEANTADVVLYTVFNDLAALQSYQTHPVHEAVKPLIKEMMQERRVVDYLTD
jgi:quinol monooxygenase YgiN